MKLVLAASAALAGCYGSSRAYVVYSEPPPVREEIVTYRPGHVWVHGRWYRDGDRWAWRSGHYMRERSGYVYNDGHWERRGNTYVWVDGGWRPRGGIVVRRY